MLELKGNVGIGHVRYPDRRLRQRSRSPTVLRQFALRHLSGAQRQSDQRGRARRKSSSRRSPPPQYDVRFRSAAQRVCVGAAARRHAARDACGYFRRRRARVSALPRRLCRGRDGHRSRHARVSRSERHSAAGSGQARDRKRHGMDACVRKRRARHARFQLRARCGRRRGGVHRRAGPACYTHQYAWRGRAHAVHFRIRLFRASRLDHRQHLGVSARMRMGEQARREDSARASGSRHRRGHSDSRHEPTAALQVAQLLASSIARASSRIAISAAPSSCRGRNSARNRCAAS